MSPPPQLAAAVGCLGRLRLSSAASSRCIDPRWPPRPPPPAASALLRRQIFPDGGRRQHLREDGGRSGRSAPADGEVVDRRRRREDYESVQVSHQEVLESVSSILRNYGFAPSGKGIDIGDLHCCPYDCGVSAYDCVVPDKQHGKHGDTGVTEAAIESPNLNVEAKNAVGKKLPSGQDLVHTRRMFFPHWRSVLTSRFSVRVFPSYVPKKERVASIQQFYMAGSSRNKWKNEGGSSPVHVGLLGRTPQLASNNQSRRLFGTAAFTLLKMLKRA